MNKRVRRRLLRSKTRKIKYVGAELFWALNRNIISGAVVESAVNEVVDGHRGAVMEIAVLGQVVETTKGIV